MYLFSESRGLYEEDLLGLNIFSSSSLDSQKSDSPMPPKTSDAKKVWQHGGVTIPLSSQESRAQLSPATKSILDELEDLKFMSSSVLMFPLKIWVTSCEIRHRRHIRTFRLLCEALLFQYLPHHNGTKFNMVKHFSYCICHILKKKSSTRLLCCAFLYVVRELTLLYCLNSLLEVLQHCWYFSLLNSVNQFFSLVIVSFSQAKIFYHQFTTTII